jgi:outer membrane protein assembly factor BamA
LAATRSRTTSETYTLPGSASPSLSTTKLQRSQQRIKNLGFFQTLEVTNTPGSTADKTVVTAELEEQSTGSLNAGIGISVFLRPSIDLALKELNFLGRGQAVIAELEFSREDVKMEFISVAHPIDVHRASFEEAAAAFEKFLS